MLPRRRFHVLMIVLFASLSLGSILLILILYKYIKTRRLVAEYSRGSWWASESSKDGSENRSEYIGASHGAGSAVTSSVRGSIYDRVLVTRFTIGFIILA